MPILRRPYCEPAACWPTRRSPAFARGFKAHIEWCCLHCVNVAGREYDPDRCSVTRDPSRNVFTSAGRALRYAPTAFRRSILCLVGTCPSHGCAPASSGVVSPRAHSARPAYRPLLDQCSVATGHGPGGIAEGAHAAMSSLGRNEAFPPCCPDFRSARWLN